MVCGSLLFCCIESQLFKLTGHELYINTVKEKGLFDLNPLGIPRTIREEEFAKLIGIEFECQSSITLCCLKVKCIDYKLLNKAEVIR